MSQSRAFLDHKDLQGNLDLPRALQPGHLREQWAHKDTQESVPEALEL